MPIINNHHLGRHAVVGEMETVPDKEYVCSLFSTGIEYTYGKRENKNDSDLDNHRMAVGVQFY